MLACGGGRQSGSLRCLSSSMQNPISRDCRRPRTSRSKAYRSPSRSHTSCKHSSAASCFIQPSAPLVRFSGWAGCESSVFWLGGTGLSRRHYNFGGFNPSASACVDPLYLFDVLVFFSLTPLRMYPFLLPLSPNDVFF